MLLGGSSSIKRGRASVHLGSGGFGNPFKRGFNSATISSTMTEIKTMKATNFTLTISDMVTLPQASEANPPLQDACAVEIRAFYCALMRIGPMARDTVAHIGINVEGTFDGSKDFAAGNLNLIYFFYLPLLQRVKLVTIARA